MMGSIFGVRFEREGGELKGKLVCQQIEIQFGLPINIMVVDDANRVARVVSHERGAGSDGVVRIGESHGERRN
jgi:hypothetical protein